MYLFSSIYRLCGIKGAKKKKKVKKPWAKQPCLFLSTTYQRLSEYTVYVGEEYFGFLFGGRVWLEGAGTLLSKVFVTKAWAPEFDPQTWRYTLKIPGLGEQMADSLEWPPRLPYWVSSRPLRNPVSEDEVMHPTLFMHPHKHILLHTREDVHRHTND